MDSFKMNERRRIGEDEINRNIERSKMKFPDKSPSPVLKPAAELIDQYKRWNSGLKQKEMKDQDTQDAINVMNKPFARYKDDEDYNKLQKEKDFLLDPMIKIKQHTKVKRKKIELNTKEFNILDSSGESGDESNNNEAESKYLENSKSEIHKRPVYKGVQAGPNRFNILPGYRWDGVDRSNGFEKKIIDEKSRIERVKYENYKWRTEDM